MTRRGKHSPIGVDIGETGVRAVQVTCVGGRYTVESAARSERPNLRDGDLAPPGSGEPRALARADSPRELKHSSHDDAERSNALDGCLQRCLRQSAFHGRATTAALDAPDVEFHALELPEAVLADNPLRGGSHGGDAASVVGFEIQRLLANPKEAVEIRHWTLPTTSASAPNTIGLAAPRTTLTQRLATFERAGMRCTRVDAAPAALCRLGCLLGRFGTDEVWGALDLGARQARLVVCVNETPVLVRTAGPGGFEWTTRIADALEISTRAAEVQKCEYGLARASRGVRSPASGSTLSPPCQTLAALPSAGMATPHATMAHSTGRAAGPTPQRGADGDRTHGVDDENVTSPLVGDQPDCRPPAGSHSPAALPLSIPDCGSVDRLGSRSHTQIGSILFGILRGDLNELAAEVKRSYEYVLSCYPQCKASDLILLGGGAGMRNLPEFLSDALGIPVRRASDLLQGESSRLRCSQTCAESIDTLGLAVGLAIGQE